MLQNDDFFNFIIVSRHIGWSSYRKQNFPSSAIWWLLLLSSLVVSDSLWPHALQHARPPCPSPSHEVCPSSCPLHQWCRPAISSSGALFSSCPQSFQHQGLFQWICSSHQMAKLLEFQLHYQSFQLIHKYFSSMDFGHRIWNTGVDKTNSLVPSWAAMVSKWLRKY